MVSEEKIKNGRLAFDVTKYQINYELSSIKHIQTYNHTLAIKDR